MTTQAKFDKIYGLQTAGNQINNPTTTCSEAANVVFTQDGLATKRIGQPIIGIVPPQPSPSQYHFIKHNTETDDLKQIQFNNFYAYRNYSLDNYNGIAATYTNQEGLKIDRYTDYTDYNPKQGFTDMVVSYAGQSSFAWIGNNGVVQGFNDTVNNYQRQDLYRTIHNGNITPVDKQIRAAPMFSMIPSILFDSAICSPNYSFINIGQYNLIAGDSNVVYRNIQPKDLKNNPFYNNYNTSIPPTLSETTPYFIGPEYPARCWIMDYVPEIELHAGFLEETINSQAWLPDNYAIDIFVRLSIYREDGTIIRGNNSSILTIKNTNHGMAIPHIAPTIGRFISHLIGESQQDLECFNSDNTHLEVFRTKMYKFNGINQTVDAIKGTYYKCFSSNLTSLPYTLGLSSVIDVNSDMEIDLTGMWEPLEIATKGARIIANFSVDMQGNEDRFAATKKYSIANTDAILLRIATTTPLKPDHSYLEYPYACAIYLTDINGNNRKLVSVITDKNLAEVPIYCKGYQRLEIVTNGELAEAQLTDIHRYATIALSLDDSQIFLTEPFYLKQAAPLSIGKLLYNGLVFHYNIVTPNTTILNYTNDYTPNDSHPLNQSIDIYLPYTGISSSLTYKQKVSTLWKGYELSNSGFNGNPLSPNAWLGFTETTTTTALGLRNRSLMPIKQFSGISGNFMRQDITSFIKTMTINSTNKTLTIDVDKYNIRGSIPSNGILSIFTANDSYYSFLLNIFTYTSVTIVGSVITFTYSECIKSYTTFSYNQGTDARSECAMLVTQGSGFSNIPVWFTRSANNEVPGFIIGKACYVKQTTAIANDELLPTTSITTDPHAVITYKNTALPTTTLSPTSSGWSMQPTGGSLTSNVLYLSYLEITGLAYNTYTTASFKALDLQRFVSYTNERRLFYKIYQPFLPKLEYDTTNPLSIRYINKYIGKHWAGNNSYGDTNALKILVREFNLFNVQIPTYNYTSFYPSASDMKDVANISSHRPAGILISQNYDLNWVIPYITPHEIGNPNNPITTMWGFNGSLFCSKDNEGIFKLLYDGTIIQFISIDTTRWIIANKSLQITKDICIFVSNKGVTAMNSAEQCQELSLPIEDDIQTYLKIEGG